VKRSETRETFSFSVLAWLQTLSMFTAVVWLLTAGSFVSNDDHFVPEEGTRV
jgi:hypothetical protein